MVLTLFVLALLLFIGSLIALLVIKHKKKKAILANREAQKAGVEKTTAGTEITDD